MFHRTRGAIEAHLTIVFTALAVSKTVQNRTGLAVANVIKELRPLRSDRRHPRHQTEIRARHVHRTASHPRRDPWPKSHALRK